MPAGPRTCVERRDLAAARLKTIAVAQPTSLDCTSEADCAGPALVGSVAGRDGAVTMVCVADMHRSTPEPSSGPPRVEHRPGTADEMLRELAPLWAEDGIDLDDPEGVPDLETLQAAMARAVERQNMALFTPVGAARDLAVDTLRRAVAAAAVGDTAAAAAALDRAQPESPDATSPTVAGCIGVALGLLDDWLSGHDPRTPPSLAVSTRLPAGHWVGERAAVDVLALARKRRAFRSLDTLIARQGGQHVLYGSALALTATLQAWAQHTDTPITDLTSVIG